MAVATVLSAKELIGRRITLFPESLVFSLNDVPYVQQGGGDDTLTACCRFVIYDLV